MGGAVAVASFAFGIGLVVFTESAGERGGGLSEDMSTKITGMLMEDVEVSSVADVTSLTDQLAKALEDAGAIEGKDVELSEEEKKRKEEEMDDGW